MSTEYLAMSGIQHFVFCRRQWALIHIEQQWAENRLTAEGRLQHETVHDETRIESRGDEIITRGLHVISHSLQLQGVCDAVLFKKSPDGIELHGRSGTYLPYPVEYKHGEPSEHTEADEIQLCAQAIALEEMLATSIPSGALFYQKVKRRTPVAFDEALRKRTRDAALEMNTLFARGHTPRVRPGPSCKSCSLREVCLPRLQKSPEVSAYILNHLNEEGGNAHA